MSSEPLLQQITSGGTGPVLVADFQAFSSAPRLSHLISTRAQGRPVYQVDPLNALSGDRAYVSLADLAAEIAGDFARAEPAGGPFCVVGYCSAAALALHVATLLARSAPTVAVLLRPSWPDAKMITTEFAKLLANLGTDGQTSPVLDGDPDECVNGMEKVLRAEIAALAASHGLEDAEDTFAELLMTYRSWLSFLLACRNDPRSAWAGGGAAVTVLPERPEDTVPRLSPDTVRNEQLPVSDDDNPVTPEVVDLVIAQVISR